MIFTRIILSEGIAEKDTVHSGADAHCGNRQTGGYPYPVILPKSMKWPTILTSRDLRPSFRLCNLYDEGVFVLQNRFRYMLLGIAVILFGIACSSLKILEWVALLSPFLGLGLVLFACFFDMDN